MSDPFDYQRHCMQQREANSRVFDHPPSQAQTIARHSEGRQEHRNGSQIADPTHSECPRKKCK